MNNYAITLNDKASSHFLPWEFSNIKNKNIEIPITFKDLNIQFIKFLQTFDLIVLRGRIFHVGPNTKYNIHVDWGMVDGKPTNNIAKLNYVLNGKDSYMVWYKEKIGATCTPYIDNLGITVNKWLENDVEEVYKTHVPENKLTLVGVGIPHTLVNPIEYRTCYSMFLFDTKTKKYVVFDDAKERLKNYLLLPQ